MAKWSPGDTRWIAKEQPDPSKLKAFEWIERNAQYWSQGKLKELLTGIKVETDFAQCKIDALLKCKGDAVVNCRKSKILFFYEWAMELRWSGALINGDTNVNGTIYIPNLSEEHDMKDVDIHVRLETSGPESEIVKDMMRTTGGEIIRRQMSQYVNSLKEEFSRGLLPEPDSLEEIKKLPIDKRPSIFAASFKLAAEANRPMETGEFKTTEVFKCTADEFYRAMTVKELVQVFTQGKCVLDAKVGGRFELFDGNVLGFFLMLIHNKTVHMKWRLKTWPGTHYSEVRIDIFQKADTTEISVHQKDIPKYEVESTKEGWKRFYWDSMKRTLGFGALLF